MKDYKKKTISFYDSHVEEYLKNTLGLQDAREKKWLNKFIAYMPPEARVLDLGCAYGRDSKFLSEAGLEVYGVDLSTAMIKRAKQFAPEVDFQVMDMMDLKYEGDFFHGIWCSAALIHLKKKDAEVALSEIKRVLKKEGKLYLALKEGEGEKTIKDDRYEGVSKFYSYYTEKKIRSVLNKFGFEIVELDNFNDPNDKYRNTGLIFLISENTK